MSTASQRSQSIWARIVWFEPLWLLMLAPSVLFPGRFWAVDMQPVLIAALFAFWPIRLLASRSLSVKSPLNGWILLLMLWLPVTWWISISRDQSWASIGYLLYGVAIFYALINWKPARGRPSIVLLPLLTGGLFLAAIGPLLIDTRAGSRIFRIVQLDSRLGLLSERLGEEVNPNVFAGALVMIIPLALALMLEGRWTRRWIWPVVCGLIALMGLLSLVITQSRGAYLAVAVALVVLMLLRWRQLLWAAGPLTVGVGLLVWWLGLRTILDQLSSDTSLVGLSGRLEIWQRSLWAIQDFVFTGVGFGLFNPVVSTLYPFFLLPTDIPHAHNLLLQVGVDMGLVGLMAYLGVVITVIMLNVKTLRRTRTALSQVDGVGVVGQRTRVRQEYLTQTIAAGALAALSGMLAHGLFDAVSWGTKLTFIPWMVFALSALNHYGPRTRRRRRRRTT